MRVVIVKHQKIVFVSSVSHVRLAVSNFRWFHGRHFSATKAFAELQQSSHSCLNCALDDPVSLRDEGSLITVALTSFWCSYGHLRPSGIHMGIYVLLVSVLGGPTGKDPAFHGHPFKIVRTPN